MPLMCYDCTISGQLINVTQSKSKEKFMNSQHLQIPKYPRFLFAHGYGQSIGTCKYLVDHLLVTVALVYPVFGCPGLIILQAVRSKVLMRTTVAPFLKASVRFVLREICLHKKYKCEHVHF